MLVKPSSSFSSLEPIHRRHIRDFQHLASDEDVSQMCNFPTPFPKGGAEMWIERSLKRRKQNAEFSFAILDACSNLIGVCTLTSVSLATKDCMITYWIGKPFWGLGIATTAAYLVLTFGFEKLGLEQINAHAFAHNRRSLRLLETLGFREKKVHGQRLYDPTHSVLNFQVRAGELASMPESNSARKLIKMLHIRNEQMLSFKEVKNEQFIRKIVTQLQWYFSNRVKDISTSTLTTQVTSAVELADTILRIDDDRAVELFASITVLVDPKIHEHDDFKTIAFQSSLSWYVRMKQAYEKFV